MLEYRSASSGVWITTLLPLALFFHQNNFQSNILLTIITINTVLLCVTFATSRVELSTYPRKLKPINSILSIFALFFVISFSNEPNPYLDLVYIPLNFAFPYVFSAFVRYFPRSFTFGEAVLVTQGFTYVFWSAVTNVPFPPTDLTGASESEIIFIFVQGGFLVALLACRFVVMAKNPWHFHLTEEFFCIWAKCCLVGLFYNLNSDDVYFLGNWVLNFFLVSKLRRVLFVYCMILILAAFGVVIWKHYTSVHVTTAYRKYFHFLIVAVYLPGILSDINLLHICSAATMYILLFVEIIRFLNLNVFGVIPIGEFVDSKLGIFRDHQDEGRLIVTPLYLLAGCSLPIWLIGLNIPSRELTNALLAASLSGVLSIGVGDTFASIGGSMYGRYRWKGTTKSVEGTICSIVSQIIFICLLLLSGMCSMNFPTVASLFLASVVNALVEGWTDQIDNLVLPLVAYNIVLGVNYILKLIPS